MNETGQKLETSPCPTASHLVLVQRMRVPDRQSPTMQPLAASVLMCAGRIDTAGIQLGARIVRTPDV